MNDNSLGVYALTEYSHGKISIVKVNVTLESEVTNARSVVENDLNKNNHQLYAIVNNAGILVSTEIEMGNMEPFVSQI